MGEQRKWVGTIGVLLMMVVLWGCGASRPETADSDAPVASPEDLVAPGNITYGTAATFPPFEFQQDGELTGFDIEMMDRLAGYMGLETEALDQDFDGLIPALNGGRIDVINSAMYITPERQEQVDFVPYMVIGEAVIVPKGNPENVRSLDDLSGLTVAVTRGAIGEVYMTEQNDKLKEAGKEPMEIRALPTNQDALLAVTSGQADAFDTSIPGAAHLLKQRPGEFEVATTFDLGTEIGIAVRKGDEDMKRAMEEAMQLFVEEGHYEKLLEKYNLPPETNYFADQK